MSVSRGTQKSVSRRGAASRTVCADRSGTCSPRTTPIWSLRGGGAVPVLGQSHGWSGVVQRISTTESLPFLWHRRQHGAPEGADSVGSDVGAGECGFLPGTPIVGSDMERAWLPLAAVRGERHGAAWLLLFAERRTWCGECRLLSVVPCYYVASGAVAGILS